MFDFDLGISAQSAKEISCKKRLEVEQKTLQEIISGTCRKFWNKVQVDPEQFKVIDVPSELKKLGCVYESNCSRFDVDLRDYDFEGSWMSERVLAAQRDGGNIVSSVRAYIRDAAYKEETKVEWAPDRNHDGCDFGWLSQLLEANGFEVDMVFDNANDRLVKLIIHWSK